MTWQPGKYTITVHVLPNISLKFGQLIEYNMNIFLGKSYAKYGREAVFSKK